MISNSVVDTSISENGLQKAVHSLICRDIGLQTSSLMTKLMAFHGADAVRAKIVVDGTVLEQVSYFGLYVSDSTNNDW